MDTDLKQFQDGIIKNTNVHSDLYTATRKWEVGDSGMQPDIDVTHCPFCKCEFATSYFYYAFYESKVSLKMCGV